MEPQSGKGLTSLPVVVPVSVQPVRVSRPGRLEKPLACDCVRKSPQSRSGPLRS